MALKEINSFSNSGHLESKEPHRQVWFNFAQWF